jgi:hypothetical protein
MASQRAEIKLRELIDASIGLNSELSLDSLLQKIVETAV